MIKERAGLNIIAPYKAAKNYEAVKRETGIENIIKLAGNENRLGCSENVIKIIQKHKEQFSFYPDMNCTILKNRLSLIHGIKEDNLVFGNGSFELISLIALAYLEAADESILSYPSFGWYKNVTLQMNAAPVIVPLKEFTVDTAVILNSITKQTKIIWICNPNNPTGTVLRERELREFIRKVPDNILIVLDEAYIDFVEADYFDTVSLIKENKNIILLRTFSKLYGLASFRIGYGMADEDIVEKINKVRLPINVSLLAQKAAEASLEDDNFKNLVLKNNRDSLKLYYSELDKEGIKYIRSNGNFILIYLGIPGAVSEKEFLRNGIMIRNASEFGLDGWVRISIGTFEENEKVIQVLKKLYLQIDKEEKQ